MQFLHGPAPGTPGPADVAITPLLQLDSNSSDRPRLLLTALTAPPPPPRRRPPDALSQNEAILHQKRQDFEEREAASEVRARPRPHGDGGKGRSTPGALPGRSPAPLRPGCAQGSAWPQRVPVRALCLASRRAALLDRLFWAHLLLGWLGPALYCCPRRVDFWRPEPRASTETTPHPLAPWPGPCRPLKPTDAHTHARAHTHTHTHTHTQKKRTCAHARTHARTHAHIHTHTAGNLPLHTLVTHPNALPPHPGAAA
jgi:ABC-type nickel/cobalt efflux system permease component RcnA